MENGVYKNRHDFWVVPKTSFFGHVWNIWKKFFMRMFLEPKEYRIFKRNLYFLDVWSFRYYWQCAKVILKKRNVFLLFVATYLQQIYNNMIWKGGNTRKFQGNFIFKDSENANLFKSMPFSWIVMNDTLCVYLPASSIPILCLIWLQHNNTWCLCVRF